MKISFLLGSGISQPILKTNVDTITSSLINDFWEKRGNLFYKRDNQDQESGEVKNYKYFIKEIIKELRNVYKHSEIRTINYEHIYYVCDQIKNQNDSSTTNPLAVRQLSELQKKCSHLSRYEFSGKKPFPDFAQEVLRYIDSVVFNHLIYPDGVNHFIPLFEEFRNKGIFSNIFTLNHDLLLEKYFRQKEIAYNDFFEKDKSDLRKFSIKSVGKRKGYDFCLYKLHGSINWIRSQRSFFDYYVIDDFSNGLLQNFHTLSKLNGIPTIHGTPEFLTGYTNKSFDYFHGIFSFLFGKFIERIHETEVLIVSGFGWKDYVIRQIIIEWLFHKSSRKLILCYKDDSDPKSFLGPKIDRQQILNTGKWLSEIGYDSIEEHLQ